MISKGADESDRKSHKLSTISCQKEVSFSDKLHDATSVKVAKELLCSGKYTAESSIIKSTHIKSRISNYLQTDTVDKVLKRVINEFKKEDPKNFNNKLKIQYSIIENSRANRVEVGYLDFKFLLDDKIIYEAQIDYIGKTGEDISRRIKCVINSFISI